jgi:hypothetical protein
MSSFSEQGSIDPDNPKLDYSPLRLSERAAKLGPLVSQGASEPVRPSPMLRPVLVPKAIDEPAQRTPNLDRRTALLSVAAAVAGVVAVATPANWSPVQPHPRQRDRYLNSIKEHKQNVHLADRQL